MTTAIIVAAGRGERMNASVAKQYLEINGVPILAATVQVFDEHSAINQLRIVVPASDIAFCQDTLLSRIQLKTPVQFIAGGKLRQESVYQGLCQTDPSEAIVVIHDGVRPLVTDRQISECIDGARKTGACILGMPASDTLKRIDNDGRVEATVPRDGIWLAQTPQAFAYDVIKTAHDDARASHFYGTDDAELVERMGHPVSIIPGGWRNIKITTPADLEIAQRLISE